MKELIKLTNQTSIYPADMNANWLILNVKEAGPLYTDSKDLTRPEIKGDDSSVDRTEVFTSVLELAKRRLSSAGQSIRVYQVGYRYCLGSITDHRLRWLTDFDEGARAYEQEVICELKLERVDRIPLRKSEISLHYFALRVFDRACPLFSDSLRLTEGEYKLEVVGLTSGYGERVLVNQLSPKPGVGFVI